jgi:hypothetical protein
MVLVARFHLLNVGRVPLPLLLLLLLRICKEKEKKKKEVAGVAMGEKSFFFLPSFRNDVVLSK